MKQIEVQIMGQNYVLSCPENSEVRLAEAVNTVNSAMCKIRDAGKIKARDRIAVLSALNLAYQFLEPALPVADAGTGNVGAGAGAGAESEAEAAQTAAWLDSLLLRLDAALAAPLADS